LEEDANNLTACSGGRLDITWVALRMKRPRRTCSSARIHQGKIKRDEPPAIDIDLMRTLHTR
jgi:hypothetical protein